MFEKGDYIIYGSIGVCQVTDITEISLDGVPKDKLYYVLHPVNQDGSKIFTPVDNNKNVIRKLISKEEVLALIDEIPDIEELWIANDRMREEKYKECIRSCDCREWVKVIKTLHLRKKERLSQGRKTLSADDRYLKLAEENLYSELSIQLGIPKDEVEKYITTRIKQLPVK